MLRRICREYVFWSKYRWYVFWPSVHVCVCLCARAHIHAHAHTRARIYMYVRLKIYNESAYGAVIVWNAMFSVCFLPSIWFFYIKYYFSVDGVWTTWSDWDACSRSCGGGVQWRTRNCTGPFYGGKECADSANQSRDCNINPCPGQFGTITCWLLTAVNINIYLITKYVLDFNFFCMHVHCDIGLIHRNTIPDVRLP